MRNQLHGEADQAVRNDDAKGVREWLLDATQLKEFATKIGIPSAAKLRKDELEKALKHFIRTGKSKNLVKRRLAKSGTRVVDKGLRLDLPVVHYTSNKETKDFIQQQASRTGDHPRRMP